MSEDPQGRAGEEEYPGTDESVDAGEKTPRVSPGHMLRSAREQKGLSLDELVAQTLLSRATVEALENNQFERLSQPVFVRGYYRKCAKVLGMPEGELMDAYAQWTGEPGPQPASPRSVDVVPQDVTPRNWRILGFLLLLLAIGAVAFAAWVFLPRLIGPAAYDGTVESDTTVGSELNIGAEGAVTQAVGEDQSPAAAPASDELAAPAAEPAATEGQSAAAAAQPDAAGPASNELVLTFDSRSWVEVRDANDELLLSGIVPAGNQRSLSGEPPYTVALGYAPGVSISIGGQTVDVAEQARSDNTARLTINAPGGE